MTNRLHLVAPVMRTRAGRAGIAACFWTGVGLVFSLPSVAMGLGRQALEASLAQWWAWGLVTPLIFAADRWLPFTGKQLGRRVAAHLGAGLVFTAMYLYLLLAARALLGLGTWDQLRPARLFSRGMAGTFLWGCLVYWLIAGALQAYRYYERFLSSELRAERLERRFTEARLNALRMQLDPHFLFNALNTISSQVEHDPKLTRRMIEHLGDLLRMSLENKDRREIPLGEELAFLEHYLAIQRIRFGEQLKVEVEVEPAVRSASVPCLMLQPLVENAIRHGISRRAAGGTVKVAARSVEEQLEIRVTDDGAGLPEGWSLETAAGLGLQVTRDRIAGLYPDRQSRFVVRRRMQGGTEVEIVLPLRRPDEEAHGHAAD